MVIKLKTQHRTLDAIIIWIFVAVAADPVKVGLIPMFLDFGEAGTERRGGEEFMEGGYDAEEEVRLGSGEGGCGDAFEGDYAVVVKGSAQMALL